MNTYVGAQRDTLHCVRFFVLGLFGLVRVL